MDHWLYLFFWVWTVTIRLGIEFHRKNLIKLSIRRDPLSQCSQMWGKGVTGTL